MTSKETSWRPIRRAFFEGFRSVSLSEQERAITIPFGGMAGITGALAALA
jgi:hypothetical protein